MGSSFLLAITDLEIDNFKGIQSLKLSNFGRFNVFIGKNDASKSTILEAIYSFRAVLFNQPQPDFSKILRSTLRAQHARNLWHDYSTAVDPTIQLIFNGIKFN